MVDLVDLRMRGNVGGLFEAASWQARKTSKRGSRQWKCSPAGLDHRLEAEWRRRRRIEALLVAVSRLRDLVASVANALQATRTSETAALHSRGG
jgi:hypothetical protein